MNRYTTRVPDEVGSISLMRAMRQAWPLLPERALRDALKKRDVLVNGQRLSSNQNIKPGDEIVLYTSCAQRDIPIVFEDEHFLLVNKPAGVNSDRNVSSPFSLISWAEERAAGVYQPFLCHRLDNQTSGLCLMAKDEASADAAKAAFKTRDIVKTYQCIVLGTPQPSEATLIAYLTKDAAKAKVKIRAKQVAGAREIVTAYRVLAPGEMARLEVRLLTGRTHQIRAHLAYIGHPILGDDVYGSRSLNRDKGQPGVKLCAVSLAFPPDSVLESLRGRTFSVPAPF